MDTLKIKALLSAVKNKSLSKAAEEFSYTPSALSHMADALESELNVPLLKRTPKGVELTEEGKILYDKLETVVNAEKELFLAAAQLSEEREREIRIGTYSSIAQYVLPELLKSFKKAYPQTKVSIKAGNNLCTWLEEDIADIIFGDAIPLGKNEWIPFMKDPYVAVVPSVAFSNRKSVNREELYAFPYISTNEGKLKNYFDESKFAEVVRFDSVDDTSVISMVKEGIGITVLPSLILKKHMKGIHVVKLEPEISRTLGFAYRRNAGHSASTKKFIVFLNSQKLDFEI
ncbi:MAG: LysR family transcriptional regulator [Clostridia bacterium]|nr:LysR family transcriptional regulator [Clostridia bacterium]